MKPWIPSIALLLTGLTATQASAMTELVEPQRVTVVLNSGSASATLQRRGAVDETLSGGGQNSARVISYAQVPTTVTAMVTAATGSSTSPSTSTADVLSVQRFRFDEAVNGQIATLEYELLVGMRSLGRSGSVIGGVTADLYAPDGTQLLDTLWTDEFSGIGNLSFADQLGPVSFVIVPGVYRIELAAVASATSGGDGVSDMTINTFYRFNVSPVPEPSTWALWAGGLGVLVLARTRRRLQRPLPPVLVA